jgi:hypothetical protein
LDIFVEYIAFLNPDLRERLCNASELLPGILMNRLLPGKLVLETYTIDQLSELYDRSLNELFQFTTSKDVRPMDTVRGIRADQINTASSSGLVDGEVRLQGQPPEEAVGRPKSSTSESLELEGTGSPVINLGSGEWQSMDLIESIASRSSSAEPLSEMPLCEALITEMTPEDISMDMGLPHDLSQPAFPPALPSTPSMPTVEAGLGASFFVAWSGGAESRFYHPEQFSNLDGAYLSSPMVSPTLLPLSQTTAEDALAQDVPFPYSAPFFEDVG